MVLSQERVERPLWVWDEVLPQEDQFKYLWVFFMSEERVEQVTERWISAASAGIQTVLVCGGAERAEPEGKTLFTSPSLLVPLMVSTCGSRPEEKDHR